MLETDETRVKQISENHGRSAVLSSHNVKSTDKSISRKAKAKSHTISAAVSEKVNNSVETLGFATESVAIAAKLNQHTSFTNRRRFPWMQFVPHPLLQQATPIGRYGIEYQTSFHNLLTDFYCDHVIDGQNILPGAAMVEIGLAAVLQREVTKLDQVELHEIEFLKPLSIGLDKTISTEYTFRSGVRITESETDNVDTLLSVPTDFCNIKSITYLDKLSRTVCEALEERVLDAWKVEHNRELLDLNSWYEKRESLGHHRGSFRTIAKAWQSDSGKSVMCQLCLQKMHKHDSYYYVHPAILDGAIQLGGLLRNSDERDGYQPSLNGFLQQQDDSGVWVPVGIERVTLFRKYQHEWNQCLHDTANQSWACMRLEEVFSQYRIMTISICNEVGQLLLEIRGLRMHKFKSEIKTNLSKG